MNENNRNLGKIVVGVGRASFSFEKKFNLKYGEFVLKANNFKAGQIKKFTVNDIELIKPSELSLDHIPAFKKELIKKGYVPLDVYCANALNELMTHNYALALHFYPDLPFTNIIFLGSTLNKKNEQNSGADYYAFFEYDYFGMDRQIPKFVCSHNNPGSLNSEYVAAVFKKSFLNEDQPAETANQIKEVPKETLTLEELYIKQIWSLREKNAELQKKYDELLGKYNKEILKISKPQLNTETIELLCKRVCNFNLSARVINATDAYKIIYLFQLVSMSKDQLGRIRNIYKKSIKEIEDFVSDLGLLLGTNFSPEELNYFWEKIEKKLAAK